MGDAKRRKQALGEDYGKSPVFTYTLYRDKNEFVAELPQGVPRQPTKYATGQKALADAVIMFSFLQEPDLPETRERVAGVFEDGAVEVLESLVPDLGKHFWMRVTSPEGETLGDFATHDDLIEDVSGKIWAEDVLSKAGFKVFA